MSTKSGGDNDPINEEYTGNVTEVGVQAVWSLSSCKPGNCALRWQNLERLTSQLKMSFNHSQNPRLWCRTIARQLYGHILAVGWSAAAFGEYSISAENISQSNLYLHRLQTG